MHLSVCGLLWSICLCDVSSEGHPTSDGVCTEALGFRWSSILWTDCDSAKLDVLSLLRHGRAMGIRRRFRPLLGICQSSPNTFFLGATHSITL